MRGGPLSLSRSLSRSLSLSLSHTCMHAYIHTFLNPGSDPVQLHKSALVTGPSPCTPLRSPCSLLLTHSLRPSAEPLPSLPPSLPLLHPHCSFTLQKQIDEFCHSAGLQIALKLTKIGVCVCVRVCVCVCVGGCVCVCVCGWVCGCVGM